MFRGGLAKSACSQRSSIGSKPGVSSATRTHRRADSFWLVLAHRLSAHHLPLFPRQLITPINISLQILAASQTVLTSGQIVPEHSSTLSPPQYHLLRTKHVFHFTSHIHFLARPLVFLLCRFIKRIEENPYPDQVL